MNKLTQSDSHFGHVPSNSTKRMGNLAIYEECLAIRRRLAEVDPRNTQWQHDEACLLDQIGNKSIRPVRIEGRPGGAVSLGL